MEPQRPANPNPSPSTSGGFDRRRFLLLGALGTLAACTPLITSDRQPAEQAAALPVEVPGPTTATSLTPRATTPPAGDGVDATATALVTGTDGAGPSTTATPDVLPGDEMPTAPEPPSALPPQPAVPSLLNTHGDRHRPLVALTFDACETPNQPAGYDERVIQILVAARAPATMFLCGSWVATHSDITRMLATNPLFELGNHSWGHPDFSRIKPATMELEISRTQALMYQLTGRQPMLFRMPYGNWSRPALAEVSRAGLHTVQWDVVTGDPDPHVSAKMIIGTVQQQARNGSIIVMHMNGRGVHTHEALPTLIHNLRSQGYVLATASQVLGLAPLMS